MTSDRATITEQAIAWHLRADTMAVEEWPTFVAWLEATAGMASRATAKRVAAGRIMSRISSF